MLNSTKSYVRDYLIKQLPSATAFINTKFEVEQASDQWIDSFDFSAPEVFGKTLFELFGEVGERWRSTLERCFKGDYSGHNVDSYHDNNGKEIHIQWQNIPWYDENENIIGAIIQNQDISQRIANEQKLETLGAFLEEKSKTAKIGSWEMNFKGDIWWCSLTKKIHGVSDDYIPTKEATLAFFKKGASQQKVLNSLKLAHEKGKPWSDRFQIVTQDGKEKWVLLTGNPIIRKGKEPSIIGTYSDITKKIKKETKTKENERLLQTLINHLPLNVYIKDIEGKKLLANKQELDFYGLKDEKQMLGKDDTHFMKGESLRASLDDDEYVFKQNKPILGKENIVVANNGKEITFITSKIPLLDELNKVIGLVGFSLDISDLKTKEEELRKLINVTSLQNKKLVDFAHIISHNLRSHAANFSMLLEFLVTETNDVEKKNITEMLVNASDGLLETLNNLNEVVAISSNIQTKKEPIYLRKAVNKIGVDLKYLIKESNTTIINKIDDDLTVEVIPEYLDNIIANFITNGIKYKSPIRDPVITIKSTKGKNSTVLTIEDNGLGIDLKKHGDKLFGMYKTFHNNDDAKGIGLFFVKKQIEAMNGKVTVNSEVAIGTIFKIYFNE